MSYHKIKIHKHSHKSPFKIQEEFFEYLDALSTNNKIMAAQELSDIYGCIESEAAKIGITINDLKVMSDLTKDVFIRGHRVNDNLITYLKNNCDSLYEYGLGFVQVKCGNFNYNFYHRDLLKFSNCEAPHNHKQNFISEIVKGDLYENVYSILQGDKIGFCGCGDTSLKINYDYKLNQVLKHSEGSLYFRDSKEYHSVSAEHGTITKVMKFGETGNAFILSEEQDEKYQSNLTEEALWKTVEEVYNV